MDQRSSLVFDQVVISTDAHSITDLDNPKFGIGIARRGGVRPVNY
ncbi:MAG TPA: hypothetical protein VFC63_29265 [Blastocatellia bacterium]|nr:hypothetical protein [Blastocatellia bacterium]